MNKNAKDASCLGAIGICEAESSGDDNDSGDEKNAPSAPEPEESTKSADSSIVKKAPKARKSFGAPSSKKPPVLSPRSPPRTRPAVVSSESRISTEDVLPVIPLVVNTELEAPPKLKVQSVQGSSSVAAPASVVVGDSAMNESQRVQLFDSTKKLKTESRVQKDAPSLTSDISTKADKSAVTVTASGPSVGQTVRVVRLPAGSFRTNPQRDLILNGLLERKVAALKTESAQTTAKRSLSPIKSQESPPKKKRGRKSEGAVAGRKPAAEPEVPEEPPPRRDGRPRRSAAPKSFKSSLKTREYDEEATTSDSDGNDDQPEPEEKAKPAVTASQPPVNTSQPSVQRVVQRPVYQLGRPLPGMTVIPRVVAASPAGFDKSLEQLLQTPVTLFQCQLCGIYLPRKDVTLSHIKRMHRVEDDLRAANNCVMIKRGRAQSMPIIKEQLHLRKKTDADCTSVSTSKLVQTTIVPKSPKLDKVDEVKMTSVTGVQQVNLSNKYRCQQCRKLFDNRQSALTHYELAHSS